MEELQSVARAEAESLLRVAERLAATAVAVERPCEHVVAVDRGPLGARRPGEREGGRQTDAVVDIEERRLEIGLDPVRDEQPLDHADQRVLLAAPACGWPLAR